MSTFMRTFVACAVAAVTMAAFPACSFSIGSKTVSKADVASQITSKMTDPVGNKPDSVSCPDDLKAQVGAQLNCQMRAGGDPYDVNVTVTSVGGDQAKFDMVFTVDKQKVATWISDDLAKEYGSKPDSVACPENLKAVVDTNLRCELKDDGKSGIL